MQYEIKNSSIDLIEGIPKNWEKRRLKTLLTVLRGGSPRPIEEYLTDSPDGINWIKIGDTTKGVKEICSTKQKIKPSGLAKSRMVHKGDLLLTNSMSFGEPYFLEVDGCIHDGWVCLTKLHGIDKLFLYYFLRSDYCKTQFQLQVDGGVVQNLNIDKIGDTYIYLPPLSEQQSIASYLDEKCAAIDEIIAEAKATIDEYKSWKASVIFEAVTKGLNPNAEMKDSGVEWIGKVPVRWMIDRIGKHAKFYNGDRSSNYPKPEDYVPIGIPFLTSYNLENDYVDTSNHCKYISEEKYQSLSGAKLMINDIVFCLRGSVGKCSINLSETSGTVASSLMTIRAKDLFSKYLFYVLRSDISLVQVSIAMNGTCAANLSAENVALFKIPIPPLSEQQSIAAYLDEKCAAIDGVIAEKEALIGELESYKKSLIFETVTGKRRVC